MLAPAVLQRGTYSRVGHMVAARSFYSLLEIHRLCVRVACVCVRVVTPLKRIPIYQFDCTAHALAVQRFAGCEHNSPSKNPVMLFHIWTITSIQPDAFGKAQPYFMFSKTYTCCKSVVRILIRFFSVILYFLYLK